MMCFQQCQNKSAGLGDQSACHGKEQVPVSVEMQVQHKHSPVPSYQNENGTANVEN